MEKNEKRPILGSFQNDVRYFMGSVDSTLKQMDNRLTTIEGKVGQVCPAHDSMVKLFNGQKETNIEQKARNDARTVEQTAQDVKIRDLEESDRVITAKLSPADARKIDLTLKAAIGSIAVWALTYVLKYVFGISL